MNNNIYLRAIAISLVSNNGKFSYSQTGEMYSKVSSYQVKRWLDKNGNALIVFLIKPYEI